MSIITYANLSTPILAADPGLFIQSLFAGGGGGVALDLVEASSLYRDSARTTPVSTTGDLIGSVTDLSGNGKHASQATTASKPPWQGYGTFDGVDDFLVTPAIDFTGTDKATVIASWAIGSTSGIKMLAELSATSDTNNGSFASYVNTNLNDVVLRGTGRAVLRYSDAVALDTPVVSTAEFDIAGATATDEILLRRNGATAASSVSVAGPAGTGNFGNHALYIGRRGGASLPFNGRIYRIIVIGRTLTAAERAKAEAWCAAPAGVVLP